MKVLILGSTGMVGSEITSILSNKHEIIAPDKNEMDIISWDGVIENLQKVSPDLIINCVGFTDMKACETEDFAVRKINVEGPRNLAQCSARFECKLIHISCDHVFDGKKMMPQPYFEDDMPRPLTAYGKSKMESEVAIRENAPNYFLVRTGCLYSINGNNYLKSVVTQALRKKSKIIRVADNQYGSPTWVHRFALQVEEIIRNDGRGTYHATAESYCSQLEYAECIVDKLGLKVKVEPLKQEARQGPEGSPLNFLLENSRLKKQGVSIMKDWKEDLDLFLEKFGEELIKGVKSNKMNS
ncbi:MAG: NAD(P)-dependent oxidoreductase [Desulfobacterales bacterium]|nr:NAD(P)-dependent oxidoreductase [Desulfobacterales bacterium]